MSVGLAASKDDRAALRQLAMQIALQLPSSRREAEEVVSMLADIVRWRAGDPYAFTVMPSAPTPIMKLV